MKHLLTIFSLFAALVLFNACEPDVLALENSTVYGVVRDIDSGEPVSFAKVFLNGSMAVNTNADANGNYRFENLREGVYTISTEMQRYHTPYIDVNVLPNATQQVDIDMEFMSMLSTNSLYFTSGIVTMQIVVTNLLNVPIDVTTEENEMWLRAEHFISGLEPGQSEVITVKVASAFLNGSASSPLIVNIEEDFGFDIYESYVVDVRVD